MHLVEAWPNLGVTNGGGVIVGTQSWRVDGLSGPSFAVVDNAIGGGVRSIGPNGTGSGQKNYAISDFELPTTDHYFRGNLLLVEEGAGPNHSFRFNVRLEDHGAGVYSYYMIQAARWGNGYLRQVIRIDQNALGRTIYTDSVDPGESFEMEISVVGSRILARWGAFEKAMTDTVLTAGKRVGFNTGPDAGTDPLFTQGYNFAFGDALGRPTPFMARV